MGMYLVYFIIIYVKNKYFILISIFGIYWCHLPFGLRDHCGRGTPFCNLQIYKYQAEQEYFMHKIVTSLKGPSTNKS